jgi:pyruvate dehydrogenase kinase 2/3/4
VRNLISDAAADAKFLCFQTYGRSPEIDIRMPSGGVTIAYIPAHLHHILFELFKNALRAVTERHHSAQTLPPIRVTAVRGSVESVTIKVADQGGGIPRSMLPLLFSYMYTTASKNPDNPTEFGPERAPLSGLGYGLPIARLYARYFGGDVQLMSIEGLGSDAFVFLKAEAGDARELLHTYDETLWLPSTHSEPSVSALTQPSFWKTLEFPHSH